ncbi:nicotinate phosphoribosyltransferase [Methylophaga sp. OBS4]|uniref:nicotinate phosphoribosyltransferase n=1 Tax=Methylophaga sp. OBS4 TaxID=2991935 RepID=UPI00224EACEA|nr:nicotinate phosphoribosyltransferase [Methylophaga sp. OBS4]MCX4186637.1 nicotinate phosphoribosyltransferase [Methylophaga sp. OBS4]
MNINEPYPQVASPVEGAAQDELALFTDLYELTMLQAYFDEEMMEDAVFSLAVRNLPARRNFLLTCGLDTVLSYLENLQFNSENIAYLRSLGQFSERFLSWLLDFRFTGEVRAVAEGTPIFANEPILEVTAPLPQAQLIETFVMNQIHLQTVLASKALRMVAAAKGRPVVDFGARRIHGIDAAMKAARSYHISGIAATSNVLAGQRYDIPITGTMAHSYIQAHEDEAAAFSAFAEIYPQTVILVDTYDTIAAVYKVIELAKTLGDKFQARAVRLDSGDLLTLSRETRQVLDAAGLNQVEIFVSGGLDEDKIAKLVAADAPIDGFGVGTDMGVSSDAPAMDIAYKLCEYADKGRLKLSSGKPILPGSKQIFRLEQDNQDVRDVIARASEDLPGRPLLETVMRNGKRLPAGKVNLDTIRNYAQAQIGRLPVSIRQITVADPPYPVEVSKELANFQKKVAQQVSS